MNNINYFIMNVSKKKLFDEESDENIDIKTENEYAKKYDTWREKEELHKLEQKYGSTALSANPSESSDSEDESDESLEVSEEMEKQFLKTLSMLKSKDERIYDPDYQFFEENVEKVNESRPQSKSLSFADSDDDDDGGDGDGDIFKVEKRAAPTIGSEDEARDTQTNSKNTSKSGGRHSGGSGWREEELAPLRALWSDPAISESEAFLRDYILQKRYLDGDEGGGGGAGLRDDEPLEEDERRVEEQRQFERAYNFRFEEPDTEYLKRFPRTMNYIRPKDDRRARKRAEVRARKEEEKKKKMEEIARMKALKLKEIQEKIAKIKEVTGNQDLAFQEEDVEGEFDPEAHDRRMRALFDDQYYGQPDAHKPEFPELDEQLEIENWERYEFGGGEAAAGGAAGQGAHCEDDDFNMDANFEPMRAQSTLLEHIQDNLGKKRRSRKRKSKLAELLSEQKPRFVPTADRTYAQHMEEYYALDCEDVIAGELPTRFKYRSVVPNDYGLTVEEILLADDKELTQWAPLKKILKYRAEQAEREEAATFARRGRDAQLKRKLLPCLFQDVPEEPDVPAREGEIKKKKKKKKNAKNVNDEHEDVEDNVSAANGGVELEGDSKSIQNEKKKKKRKESAGKDDNVGNTISANDANSQETKVDKEESNKFIVEAVASEATRPSRHNGNALHAGKKNKNEDVNSNIEVEQKNNLKRKANDNNQILSKKKKIKNDPQATLNDSRNKKKSKHNKKVKHKLQKEQKGKPGADPLGRLSDGRLRAFGLNPKKYRGFLKYRKF